MNFSVVIKFYLFFVFLLLSDVANAGEKGVYKIIVDTVNSTFKSDSGKIYKVKYAYLFFVDQMHWKVPIYTGNSTPGQIIKGKPYQRVSATVLKKYKWYSKSFVYFKGQIPNNTCLERSPGNPFGKYAWTLKFNSPKLMEKFHAVMIHGSAQAYGINVGTEKNYVIKRNDNDIRDLGAVSSYYNSLGCVHITNKIADVLSQKGMLKTKVIFINSSLRSEKIFLNIQIINDFFNWGFVYIVNPLKIYFTDIQPKFTDKGERYSPMVIKIDNDQNFIGKINNRYYTITKL